MLLCNLHVMFFSIPGAQVRPISTLDVQLDQGPCGSWFLEMSIDHPDGFPIPKNCTWNSSSVGLSFLSNHICTTCRCLAALVVFVLSLIFADASSLLNKMAQKDGVWTNWKVTTENSQLSTCAIFLGESGSARAEVINWCSWCKRADAFWKHSRRRCSNESGCQTIC